MSVLAGEVVEGIDFGNQRTDDPSAHGTKWLDQNGDGARDTNEPGLAGVTIYSDLNNNGRLDRGEPSTITMRDDPNTRFDEAGRYWLSLRPGRHRIREIVPEGFRQTFPTAARAGGGGGADFATASPEQIAMNLADGESAVREVSLTIAPLCFRAFDVDVVAPNAPAGVFEALTDTQQNGCGGDTSQFDVQFTGNGSDLSFALQFVDAEFGGVLAEIPVRIGSDERSEAHLIAVDQGDIVDGLDFGNQRLPTASIHGTKWEDLNANGERERNEPGLGGVVIYFRSQLQRPPGSRRTSHRHDGRHSGDRLRRSGHVLALRRGTGQTRHPRSRTGRLRADIPSGNCR